MASVFRDHPLAVGSALQILAPGDYFTGSIGRQHPFVVVRDEERRVRAFYNVCRHKGMRALMGECGSLGAHGKIACPYHGWEYVSRVYVVSVCLSVCGHAPKTPSTHHHKSTNRYKLDGRLAKATRIKGIKAFRAQDYGLVEIPVSVWGGHLIFLHLDRVGGEEQSPMEGESLPHLAPLLARLEAEDGSFGEGMRHVARRTYRLHCNWKVLGNWDRVGPCV